MTTPPDAAHAARRHRRTVAASTGTPGTAGTAGPERAAHPEANDVRGEVRRHAIVRELFLELRDLPVDARSRHLEACAAIDGAAAGRVRRLLEDDDRTPTSTRLRVGPPAHAAAGNALDPHDPERIGPYRLVRRLGRGGMGVVYLAVRDDGTFRRRVAIKLVQRGLDFDDFLRRFEQERQILAALEHPSIARLLDGGRADDGRPYLVLEYVEGTDLRTWCETQRLDLDARVRLLREVCDAVDAAQRAGVIHCDLKPGNVLVEASGRPRLLDFGIARLANPEIAGLPVDPTRAHRPMTRAYAAPELLAGRRVTYATDVHALGTILYELLVGCRPADAGPDAARPPAPSTTIGRAPHRSGDDPEPSTGATGDPRAIRRRLRGDLDNIVLKAIARRPQDRYPDARALADDLDRFLDDRTVVATAPRTSYRAWKFLRRHRAGVVLGSATTLALTMLVLTVVLAVTFTTLAHRFETLLAAHEGSVREDLKGIGLLVDARRDLVARGGDVAAFDEEIEAWIRRVEVRLRSLERFRVLDEEQRTLLRLRLRRHLDELGTAPVDPERARASADELTATIDELDRRFEGAAWDVDVLEARASAALYRGWMLAVVGDDAAATRAWDGALTHALSHGIDEAAMTRLHVRRSIQRGEVALAAGADDEAQRLLRRGLVLAGDDADDDPLADVHLRLRARRGIADAALRDGAGADRARDAATARLEAIDRLAPRLVATVAALERADALVQRATASCAARTAASCAAAHERTVLADLASAAAMLAGLDRPAPESLRLLRHRIAALRGAVTRPVDGPPTGTRPLLDALDRLDDLLEQAAASGDAEPGDAGIEAEGYGAPSRGRTVARAA